MKCLNSICDREAYSRGLCNPCYQLARLYVLSGRATWMQLVNAGYALEKAKPGRKNSFVDRMKSEGVGGNV